MSQQKTIDDVAKEIAPKWPDGRCMGGTEMIVKAGILAGLQMAAEVMDTIPDSRRQQEVILALKGGEGQPFKGVVTNRRKGQPMPYPETARGEVGE